MSFFQWGDIELLAGNTVYGEITSIDYENMKADVEGVGKSIPIHYHCDQTAEDSGAPFDNIYPNEDDENGASAFSVGDEVIVMFRRAANTAPMILGHKEVPKPCCLFRFYLEGPDGEITTGVIFSVFDEDQSQQKIIDLEYNEDEGNWIFRLDLSSEGASCDGEFWVRYTKAGYKVTQYHSVNESENFFQPSDREVLGNGTLYTDYLEFLEGEIGYWEDWEDDEICGKHTWNIVVATEDGQEVDNEDCVLGEHTGENGGYSSISLENQVLSIFTSSEDNCDGGTCFGSTVLKHTDSDYVFNIYGRKITMKIENLISSAYLSDFSYLEGNVSLKFKRINGEEGNKRIVLYFAYENESQLDSHSPETLMIIDKSSEASSGEVILDFTEEEIFNFIDGYELYELYFFCMGSCGSVCGYGIDYIDLPRWEDWDSSEEDPDLCKNHNWRFNFAEDDYDCPFDLPATLTDHWAGSGLSTHEINIVDGIFSWSGVSNNIGTDNYFEWEATDEKDSMKGVTKLILKCTAEVSGAENYFWIDIAGPDFDISFIIAGGEVWWANAYIGDNNGEEMEIDLTSYGVTKESIIDFVYFSWSPHGDDEETETLSFTCDYVDFK